MEKEIEIRKSYIYFKATGAYPGYINSISEGKELVDLSKN
jgi:hypothetical protein